MADELVLTLRRQRLIQDAGGHNTWERHTIERRLPPDRAAIIICDMWDAHWSRGAAERVAAMVPRMNAVLHAARDRGVRIIHAPSETMSFYAGHPARERILSVPPVEPPPDLPHEEPPLPVDTSDHGSDTAASDPTEVPRRVWSRQHPALDIDAQHDVISDDGRQIYSYLRAQGIEQVLIMGVHTNMCILNRSFAIKQMVRWGVDIALVRDLTDAMYNPARPPYVDHWAGVGLVIAYIEKFWCPTVSSEQLIGHP
ncbi:MAG: isochorismatase family protein [Chloroflexi bacterium]|nr:isochorismatase family protein [Chloroflexota bacterium]